MRSPGQPSRLRASAAKCSRKSSSRGWPQLLLRDSRITCQSGPLIGRATAPARQPLAYEPIARAARGAGPGTEPNSTFAGPVGVLLTSFGATGGCTAAAFAGSLTGSAATGPQIRRSNKQAVIL